ncbi:MAG: 3'(2'),5'-bisphosphate nucleotidase CysQ family protein [Candidatus Puniceispirillaceae bacterium]
MSEIVPDDSQLDAVPEVLCDAINLTQLLAPVRAAGSAILKVKEQGVSARSKADASPVTVADEQANAILVAALAKQYPELPVISEEEAESHKLSPKTLYALVDPLDGTREFLRSDSAGAWTVNIGLVKDRRAIGGIVYAPYFDWLCWGGPATGTWQIKSGQLSKVTVRPCPDTGPVAVASRSHLDPQTEQFLDQHGIDQTKSIGSSLKFLLLATGQADIYPRFGPTMEWDTAAGEAVLAGAGGAVYDAQGQPHRYSKPGWRNGPFIACADFTVF